MAKKSHVEHDDRLGSLLVQQEMISSKQLDQAVQCQVLFGGRLGSNLLELGFITDLQLREVLEKKYGSPSVGREQLGDVPDKVIELVPRRIADKHKLIPVKIEDGVLEVAMLDPFRESSVRLVTDVSAHKIKPVIALELDICWALEKYYAIKRQARFINLDRYLSKMRPEKKAPIKPDDEPMPPASDDTPEPLFPDPMDITAMEGAPQDLEDFWDRVGRTGHPEYMIPRVLGDLDRAESRDEIAGVILDFADIMFARSLLFVVNEDILFGWDARGEGLDERTALAIMLPLSRRSAFKTVVETGAYFMGQAPDSPINRRFLHAIGPSRPKTILLLPIFVGGHVAAILYGDMGNEAEVDIRLGPLQRALAAAGQAFQRLIVKQKEQNIKLDK